MVWVTRIIETVKALWIYGMIVSLEVILDGEIRTRDIPNLVHDGRGEGMIMDRQNSIQNRESGMGLIPVREGKVGDGECAVRRRSVAR